MNNKPWIRPEIFEHCKLIAESYFNWFDKSILSNTKEYNDEDISYKLFHAPFLLVSHGIEKDLILIMRMILLLKPGK